MGWQIRVPEQGASAEEGVYAAAHQDAYAGMVAIAAAHVVQGEDNSASIHCSALSH